MNVAPVAPAPAPTPAATGTSTGGSDFAELVQQHLDEDGRLPREAANAVLDEAASPGAAPSDGLAAMVAGLLGTTVVGSSGATAGAPTSTAEGAEAPGAGAARTPGAGAAVVAGAHPAEAAVSLQAGVAAAAVGGSHAAARVGLASGVTGPALSGLADTRSGTLTNQPGAGVATGEVAAGQTTGAADAVPGGAAGADPAGADAAQLLATATSDGNGQAGSGTSGSGVDRAPGLAATLATAAGTATSGAESAKGPRGSSVTDQVFDHVTRLVSRGDGTHRMMLKLHPADLGEVQIVLTVKNGTVDVTLAAGAVAREALRDGSPQLRALLEMTGATTGQVVVRDLGGGAVSAASQQQATGFGPDQQRQGSQDALAENGSDSRNGLEDTSTDGEPDGSADSSPPAPGHAGHGSGERGPGVGRATPEVDGRAVAERPMSGAHDATSAASSFQHIPSRVDLNL